MAKKKEAPVEKLEREYVIPLREKCRNVPRYRKTEKAMKTIKEFIAKHMKVPNRDIRNVRIEKYLNELVWSRGIRTPPHKIKVKAIKEGDIVRVDAVELPIGLKMKKQKEEKQDKKAKEGKEKKKKEVVEEKTEQEKKEEEVKKDEEQEKKSAVVEAGKEMEKQAAKQMRQQRIPKVKEPKHMRRMSLEK
jgi:large subunit ribosomal protein L31e